MAKFHINMDTGEPGRCSAAEGNCPFGAHARHYNTEAEARAAFEGTFPTFMRVSKFDLLTDTELEATEVAMLQELRREQRATTDDEYDRHYEYIRRIRKTHPSTHKANTKRIKGKTVYSQERKEAQEALLKDLEISFGDIPAHGRLMFLGGVPGAGKGTLLRTKPELLDEPYALVNPDITKEALAARGMTPEINGLLPLETDELLKYEAQLLTDELVGRLGAQRKNIVIDRTLANASQVTNLLKRFEPYSYGEKKVIYVDVTEDDAFKRIRGRHKNGLDRWLTTGEGYGERPTSGAAVATARSDDPRYRWKNAKSVRELYDAGVFDAVPKAFNSSNGNEEIDFFSLRS